MLSHRKGPKCQLRQTPGHELRSSMGKHSHKCQAGPHISEKLKHAPVTRICSKSFLIVEDSRSLMDSTVNRPCCALFSEKEPVWSAQDYSATLR